MRAMLAAAPEALVAYSCDKNFALYCERVGALWAHPVEYRSRGMPQSGLWSKARPASLRPSSEADDPEVA